MAQAEHHLFLGARERKPVLATKVGGVLSNEPVPELPRLIPEPARILLRCKAASMDVAAVLHSTSFVSPRSVIAELPQHAREEFLAAPSTLCSGHCVVVKHITPVRCHPLPSGCQVVSAQLVCVLSQHLAASVSDNVFNCEVVCTLVALATHAVTAADAGILSVVQLGGRSHTAPVFG